MKVLVQLLLKRDFSVGLTIYLKTPFRSLLRNDRVTYTLIVLEVISTAGRNLIINYRVETVLFGRLKTLGSVCGSANVELLIKSLSIRSLRA